MRQIQAFQVTNEKLSCPMTTCLELQTWTLWAEVSLSKIWSHFVQIYPNSSVDAPSQVIKRIELLPKQGGCASNAVAWKRSRGTSFANNSFILCAVEKVNDIERSALKQTMTTDDYNNFVGKFSLNELCETLAGATDLNGCSNWERGAVRNLLIR